MTANKEKTISKSNEGSVSEKGTSQSNNALLMALLFCVIAIFGAAVVFTGSYDNDIWFILANGEQIAKDGIFYENPFSIHDGLSIVIQQLIPSIVSYAIYQSFGFVGLGVLAFVLYGLVMVSLYHLCRVIRNDRFGGEIIMLAMAIGLWSLSSYMSMRPHMYTMLAYIWIIYFLERYRATENVKFLIPLPVVCAIHINTQSALAPFDIVIMACYAIPDIIAMVRNGAPSTGISLANATYRRLPIVITMVISCLAFPLNPYGIDGALYLLNSFGAASYGGIIREMKPFEPFTSITSVFTVITVLVALACVVKFSDKKIDLPLSLLIVGTIVMTIMQSRNKWLPTLFCIMLIAWLTRGKSIPFLMNIKARLPISFAISTIGVVICVILCVMNAPLLSEEPQNTQKTPVATMNYLDDIHADKDTLRIFTFFNSGPYIEYRGYKVQVDSRPELWNKPIAKGNVDYFSEYVDMATGKTYMDAYINKYDFDVLIIPNDDNSLEYFKTNDAYREIPGGDDYTAFMKRDLYVGEDAE